MHKILKKTIKYTACGIGVLLLVIILFVSILYFSADMLTPDYTPKANGELVQTDSLREYAGNYLRQSNSGLWELKVSGDAFQRGEAIGKLSSDLLYYQEKVFVDQIREIVPSDNYLKFLRFFIVLFNRNSEMKFMVFRSPVPMSTTLSVLPTSANSIIIRLTIWDMPCKITCW